MEVFVGGGGHKVKRPEVGVCVPLLPSPQLRYGTDSNYVHFKSFLAYVHILMWGGGQMV